MLARSHAAWCRRIEFPDGWWHTASCESGRANAAYAHHAALAAPPRALSGLDLIPTEGDRDRYNRSNEYGLAMERMLNAR